MKKTVGENLKMFRIKKGLTMEEAGNKIGVSAPAILKYERGKIMASLGRLEAFAKAYGTTVEEILDVDSSITLKYDNIFFKEKISNIKNSKWRKKQRLCWCYRLACKCWNCKCMLCNANAKFTVKG